MFIWFVQTIILALSLKGLGETVGLALEKRLYWDEEFKLKKCALVDAADRNLREAAWTLGHKYRESGESGSAGSAGSTGSAGSPGSPGSIELEAVLSSTVDDLIADMKEYYGDQLLDCADKRSDYEIVIERHDSQAQRWPNWVYRRRHNESLD